MRNAVRILAFSLGILSPGILFSQAVGDYRSAASGTWATAGNWQTWNGTAWVAPGAAPNSTNGVITIQSGHTMQIAANLTIDQVVINSGGTVNWTGGTLTIAAGAGADLQVNGTMWDNRGAATPSITFNAGATWAMGANGTLIKSAGNSSNNWQNAYDGGIATIPATSNWILRKTSAQNPQITTVGAYYGNLTIENNVAGTWTTTAGATFNGATNFPTIKGNFDIGGTGTSTVDFLNDCQNATLVTVGGNFIVRTGNTVRNYGTGIRVAGDITVAGTVSYDADHNRIIELNGAGPQAINNTGTFNIYNFTLSKSGGSATLNNAITVNNIATFTTGILNTTATNLLTISATGSVTGANNSSFVNGPVRYTGLNAFTFPTGKGSDYQAIGISATAAAPVVFYTETFDGTVCAAGSGCDPSIVGWTSVSLGGEGADANRWYVSCQENGNAAGACGSGCGTNQTLHLGNVSTSSAAPFFCPSGDCGAAYDASGAGEVTNKRAESPTINCTGRSSITVDFLYIENGQTTFDNATLWYFDGAVWAQIDDMPKTATGCLGQGIWATRSVALPASANNNPNVRIGFRWVNNGDGTGTDPSCAINDVTLTSNPVSDFTAEYFYSNPQVPYGNTLAPTLTQISSCEYWILNRNAGTASKNVTLSFDANSCNLPTTLANFRVARHDGISTWQDHAQTATTGTAAAGTVTSNTVTSFSPFTIGDITALPIELLKFDARYNGHDVDLTWETATEINNDYFTVERSVNGIEFEPLLTVKGAGNSNINISYAAVDKEPVLGIGYYRLKQTDYDGQYSYSDIKSVNIMDGGFIHIDYTAINSDVINVYCSSSSSKPLMLSFYDMTGKKVYSTSTVCGTPAVVSKSLFSSGIYSVVLTDGERRDVKKLFVE
ncbi:MAG: hypothetical protein ACOZCO_08190 [Bacteroidota bacterium]